jgi:hypothetical protein
MANINLATSQIVRDSQKRPLSSTGTLIGSALLVVAVISALGLSLWEKSLSGKVAETESDYKQRYVKLTEGRNKDVIDFQSRIFALNDLARQRNAVTDAMQNVEKKIVSGTYVSSYDFDKNTKTTRLNCVATDHSVIARQIASFKSSEYFSDVALKSTKVSEKGGFEFLIEIVNK